MVDLIGSFRSLKPIKICVIGDFVSDAYIVGSVQRISPEAPVPVLKAKEVKRVPGMAGNVALNLVSLGAQVIALGRIGADEEGKALLHELSKEQVDVSFMVCQAKYQTPIKQRMIAGGQQLLRVDFEEMTPLTESLEDELISSLEKIVDQLHIIAISDYKKGFLTDSFLSKVIKLGIKKNLPIVVDPKGDDFSKYIGCTLIKPNLQEAYIASKYPKESSIDIVAAELFRQTQAKHILITKSEEGMSLFTKGKNRSDFPVECHEVIDVTGAGDTVLAMMTMCLGNALDLPFCVHLSNVAASIAIQKIGCARVTLAQVAESLLILDKRNKVFKEDHLFALNHLLDNKRLTILGLDDQQAMSPQLFQAFKKLSSDSNTDYLMIYLQENTLHEELIEWLISLQEVDLVLLSSGNLSKLIRKISPHQAFFMKDNQMRPIEEPLCLLKHLAPQGIEG